MDEWHGPEEGGGTNACVKRAAGDGWAGEGLRHAKGDVRGSLKGKRVCWWRCLMVEVGTAAAAAGPTGTHHSQCGDDQVEAQAPEACVGRGGARACVCMCVCVCVKEHKCVCVCVCWGGV